MVFLLGEPAAIGTFKGRLKPQLASEYIGLLFADLSGQWIWDTAALVDTANSQVIMGLTVLDVLHQNPRAILVAKCCEQSVNFALYHLGCQDVALAGSDRDMLDRVP